MKNSYDAILAERDARFVDTDEDGLTDAKEIELETDLAVETVFYLQRAYDNAVVSSNSLGRQAGRTDVTGSPGNFNLTTIEAYNMVVAERDARPTQTSYDAILAERDARFIDTDEDGLTDVKEIELETNLAFETRFYLQTAYDNVATQYLREGRKAGPTQYLREGRKAGRSDVTGNPGDFNLTTVEAYNTVVAERDARPTRDAYDTVVEERDARPTLGEVKDARLGSVVLQPDNGNNRVKIRFSIEETDDLKVWTKRDEINEVTVPLELGSKFYRFALQDE